MNANPLLQDWSAPEAMPPFTSITNEHFEGAFRFALEEQKLEIARIAEQEAVATFENTIEALEKSGKALGRVCAVFFNLTSANTNSELQRIQREISPRLAGHNSDIFLNQKLFSRVTALCEAKDRLGLSLEQLKVLERYEKKFRRSGAHLDELSRKRMTDIFQRLAELSTRFSQNVLKDEADYRLVLETEEDLRGLPDFLVRSAARTASDLGVSGKHVITLSRSSIEPFLQFSARRDLREQAFRAWISRGANGGETDNRKLITETVSLRNEMAKLLGFESYAAFKLEDKMAAKPEAARELLTKVWNKAHGKVEEEREFLQKEMNSDGINEPLRPWDWRYYAEKVRKAKYDLNEADLKPYFQLDNIISAAFETATRLFGVDFEEIRNLDTYHPDVRVWNVRDADGQFVGRFIGDYFARPSKQGGAWMSSYRSQERLNGDIRPIIVNVLNLVKGGEGEPALLTYDDARTVFHEFGHALHGMLSDVTYPSLSGTSVVSDFVELPSQLYEHWLSEKEILNKYARHVETGERIPDDMLQKLNSARNFNQGFMTIEYLACALLDLSIHEHGLEDCFEDIDQFEARELKKIGMPAEIVMRHRLPHFSHLFSGDGYAAGYYSYMWSEVMDSDAFEAFEESGNIFNPELASRLKKCIYSSGGSVDPAQAYEEFRGRAPSIEALLKKRGLKN